MKTLRILPLLLALLLSALLAACRSGHSPSSHTQMIIPGNLDTNTTRKSDGGLFQATIIPSVTPVPVNQIHTWTLHVETTSGQAVVGAAITLDGRMPQHSHGMPTEPEATQDLGNGDYLVEGMKFQMGGWWVVKFQITANGQSDSVTFNL
ncbi:MAG: FixH family protein, partial [Anaerolineae bacterium]|nr:FixH family protein [Anaerolineae bacterium]